MLTIDQFAGRRAIEFKTDALVPLRGPGVYLYCVGDTALYVGVSHKVIGRVLARNHHVLGLDTADSLLIFPCETLAEAKQLESELIATLKPTLNRRNGKTSLSRRLAGLLGTTPRSVEKRYMQQHNQSDLPPQRA